MNTIVRYLLAIHLLWALLIAGCTTVPLDHPKTYSEAITDTHDTFLGQAVAEWREEHPDVSGFYPLREGMEAFGARLRLIEAAERSIDAQYFLMKGDTAGELFAGKLLRAADRGVRVRFLLDDIFTTVKDYELALLDQHPNIEVRLYNPISRRGFQTLNFLGDFKRANRRMHNKSFTVDNQVTIVGGRNIADEYFQLKTESEFLDFDLLAIGEVAADIAQTFDLFWNDSKAVPMEALRSNVDEQQLEIVRQQIEDEVNAGSESAYARAVNSPLVQDLADGKVELYPAPVEVITDTPVKLKNEIGEEHMTVVMNLVELLSTAVSEVIVVTPYFVPQERGVEFWRNLVNKGIRVVILTNSLASTNHVAVHAGYARYRRDIIEAGVELYEVRASAVTPPQDGNEQAPEKVTLHTKALIIDRRYMFVGSLNLDPRSIEINAEMGLLVDSPEFATAISELADSNLPEFAYRVELSERGRLQWQTQIDGTQVVETSEPLSGVWRRFQAFLYRAAPESQL